MIQVIDVTDATEIVLAADRYIDPAPHSTSPSSCSPHASTEIRS